MKVYYDFLEDVKKAFKPEFRNRLSKIVVFNSMDDKMAEMIDLLCPMHPMTIRLLSRVAENYAACDKARDELGWVAEYDLDRMCEDSWRWQSNNPNGYAG